jgi:predicted RNA-binding Zn-ribbon protein involved in translation (DUF1610 family)
VESQFSEQTIQCTQCGGELHPDEGQIFLVCPYCGAAVYLDKSRVVFHWYVAPTVDESQAQAALRRWMAGNQTVKDLDRKSTLSSSSFEYFPVWYFKHRQPDGGERILLTPAAPTSVSEISHIDLPAGDLRKYTPELEAQSRPPNVPLQTAQGWLAEKQVTKESIVEQALVHIPLYTFKYAYQGRIYAAIVEAATGGVLANIYPAKSEAPFQMAAAAAAVVFLCLATFPIVGYLANGGGGAGLGLLSCSGAGILAAPVLFALAAWVAAKI